jgi:hypothetical protein
MRPARTHASASCFSYDVGTRTPPEHDLCPAKTRGLLPPSFPNASGLQGQPPMGRQRSNNIGKSGAGDWIRTHDPNLGKVVLHLWRGYVGTRKARQVERRPRSPVVVLAVPHVAAPLRRRLPASGRSVDASGHRWWRRTYRCVERRTTRRRRASTHSCAHGMQACAPRGRRARYEASR